MSPSSSPPSPLQLADDTIAALATPSGRSAIAVVRLSGRAAQEVADRVLVPPLRDPRRATRTTACRDGARLDDVVATWFAAPNSYTGEHLVEISCHGGAVTPALVLAALVAAGARLAEPGEFTRRAVLNGKLDLLQAEAVLEVIDARSRAAQRLALTQLDGGLSRRIATLRDDVLELEALVAYDIDFPEEDDGPVDHARVIASHEALVVALEAMLATAPVGELVREGASVVLAGEPNAGKSSLFNALVGRARAIVTDVPGTTRDALEAMLDTARVPVRLVDTAGLRESTDAIEKLGIEVSHGWLSRAHLVLACGETAESVERTAAVVARIATAPVLRVRTKSDLHPASPGALAVSAETGAGLAELLSEVERALLERADSSDFDAPMLATERHRMAIERARDEVVAFRRAWLEVRHPIIVAAVHLRTAANALEELIGSVDVEDVMERVFARFCVGK
ncbi:MAG: hypothetical protein JWO05_1856 [Gemmatimonadetes bacterium]|nr:hypothetical protein [Gemmatimonadota bacterium]